MFVWYSWIVICSISYLSPLNVRCLETVIEEAVKPHPPPSSLEIKADVVHYDIGDDIPCFNAYTPEGREGYTNFLNNAKYLQPTSIMNIRGDQQAKFKWDIHGFQYTTDLVTGLEECKDMEECEALLRPNAERLVKEATGASEAVAFFVRTRNQPNVRQGHQQSPVFGVHSDWSSTSAASFLEDALQPGFEETDPGFQVNIDQVTKFRSLARSGKKRMVIMHVWRPLKTIYRDPLAIIDWNTVKIEKQSKEIPVRGPHIRCRLWRHDPEHRWYYLDRQTPQEPLLLLQYDSHKDEGMTVPHSSFSFRDPDVNNAPPRQSFEVRVAAVFD